MPDIVPTKSDNAGKTSPFGTAGRGRLVPVHGSRLILIPSIRAGFRPAPSRPIPLFSGATVPPFVPSMKDRVDVRSLPVGARFEYPWSGVIGVVLSHGIGSTLVRLDRHEEKVFIPTTGRNAGQLVTIARSTERLNIGHGTQVRPC